MQATKKRKKYAVVFENDCVACGCCAKVCPKSAITIASGIYAIVDNNKCIGCGKCAAECPASVIEICEGCI
jgi:ferredoxin